MLEVLTLFGVFVPEPGAEVDDGDDDELFFFDRFV